MDPSPQFTELRAHDPFSPVRVQDGTTAWLVTRYRDQRAILADDRFSADPRRPNFPRQSTGFSAAGTQRPIGTPLPFLLMDDPEHKRLRRMFTAYFSVKRARAMKPRIEEIINQLLDEMEAAGPPIDLVSAFALPLPSLVIAEILGVPRADHPLFQRQSHVLVSTQSTVDNIIASTDTLTAYLRDLTHRKAHAPEDDLVSHLITEHLDTGDTTRDQLVQDLMLLLVAGHETTTNMLALGTLALLRHPTQLAAVRTAEEPSTIAGAVEELLRYLTIVHTGRRRIATEDVEVAGHMIKAGEGVILPNDSANRDADVFDGPDRLDITRPNARRHIAFGQGVHQCLGQNLAREELQLAYPALLRRFPTLRPAVDEKEIRYKTTSLNYGVHELPVSW